MAKAKIDADNVAKLSHEPKAKGVVASAGSKKEPQKLASAGKKKEEEIDRDRLHCCFWFSVA